MRLGLLALLLSLLLCGCQAEVGSPPQCSSEASDPGSIPEASDPNIVPEDPDPDVSPEGPDYETISYGTSGSGLYPLTAYRIGTGENVLLMTFAVHGYEDGFAQDGQVLTALGEGLLQALSRRAQWVQDQGWSVYLVPCVNPDGLNLGSGCDGPGRCTTVSGLGDVGMDINRCFPYCFTPHEEPRYYNGTAPLQCAEARALAGLAQTIMTDGKNVCVDVHGWYAQILTTGGQNWLYDILAGQFPDNSYVSLAAGDGYFSAWCGYTLGYDACLLELPACVRQFSEWQDSQLLPALEQVVEQILTSP